MIRTESWRGFDDEMPTPTYFHNDLNGMKCQIVGTVKRKLDGAVSLSDHFKVKNEDGSVELLFPWELSEIRN